MHVMPNISLILLLITFAVLIAAAIIERPLKIKLFPLGMAIWVLSVLTRNFF